LQRLPEPRNPTKQFPRDGHPLRRPSHRSGSPGKEMDIHYVAPSKRWTSTTSPRNPDRKPPEREGHPLRRLLTPRPPPPFDFGQSDRVRERDFEIAPKFAVPGPFYVANPACSARCPHHSGAEREHLGDAGTRRHKGGEVGRGTARKLRRFGFLPGENGGTVCKFGGF
jgi:hypothetical protein